MRGGISVSWRPPIDKKHGAPIIRINLIEVNMSGKDCIIELSVRNHVTGIHYVMAVNSDEFPIFNERFVEDFKAGFAFHGPNAFDSCVRTMKEKKFRREYLEMAAKKLAKRLGDHIEDAEGWHGESRRDRIKEMNKE